MNTKTISGLLMYLSFIYVGILHANTPALAKFSNDPMVKQWAYEDTGVYKAWDLATGSEEVIVAVIDNGFDTFHPDLRNNVWKNEDEIAGNGIDDDKNGYIDDVWGWNFVVEDFDGDGMISSIERKGNNDPRPSVKGLTKEEKEEGIFSHGTLVAGIIGSEGNNGWDGAGINWKVKLMNVRVLDNTGIGNLAPLEDAIRYAVDNGADVINISMVGTHSDSVIDEAVQYAYDKGVVLVASAGNDSVNLNADHPSPACSDAVKDTETVICVSAIDHEHRITNFSNIGSHCIDIAAPGLDISSTARYSPTNGLEETYSSGWSGTSFATPFVSGAAALVKSVRHEWGAKEIINTLLNNIHHTTGQNENTYANLFGAGLVQVDKAVEYAMSMAPKKQTSHEKSKKTSEQAKKKAAFGTEIVVYQPSDGTISQYNISAGTASIYKRFGLVGVDKAVSYIDGGGEQYYIVVKAKDSSKREITIYNSKWRIQKRWSFLAFGQVDLAVGNVIGSSDKEIIISPKYKNDIAFLVFDMNGNRLGLYNLEESHDGVSVALAGNTDGRKDIFILHKSSGKVFVKRFNGAAELISAIEIPSYADGGSISSGDIDGDGDDEFVVGSGPGQKSALGYYELSGSFKRKFFGYDPSFSNGINTGVFDYNSDGTGEVIITSMDGSQPVRIWDARSKKLEQWWPFGEGSSAEFLPLVAQ